MALVICPVWFRGGTRAGIQWPMAALAFLLFLFLLGSLCRRQNAEGESSSPPPLRLRAFLLDPIILAMFLFVLLLALQWWNAGRELLINEELKKWIYGPPRQPLLPSAVRRADAAEMLLWFFPAVSLVAAVRHGLRPTGKVTRRILMALCVSASTLALLGGAQWALSRATDVVLPPSESYFFTSFGYANHAGAYFFLMFCVSLGLLLDVLLSREASRASYRGFLGAMAFLCFIGVGVANVRATLLLACGVAGVSGMYFLWRSWSTCSGAVLVDRCAGLAGVALLSFFLIHIVGGSALKQEFSEILEDPTSSVSTKGSPVDRFLTAGMFGDRVLQREIAILIWKDHFWFGGGGWCQRRMASTYLDEDQWHLVLSEGKANTHCDPLQFLSEFGVSGAVLALAAVCLLLYPLWRARYAILRAPIPLFSLMGVLSVWCYSWVDLPFRSPAILYMWLFVIASLTGTERFESKTRSAREQVSR